MKDNQKFSTCSDPSQTWGLVEQTVLYVQMKPYCSFNFEPEVKQNKSLQTVVRSSAAVQGM